MNNKRAKTHHCQHEFDPTLQQCVNKLQQHGDVKLEAIENNLSCSSCRKISGKCKFSETDDMVVTVFCDDQSCPNLKKWHVCLLCTNFTTGGGIITSKVSRHCQKNKGHINAREWILKESKISNSLGTSCDFKKDDDVEECEMDAHANFDDRHCQTNKGHVNARDWIQKESKTSNSLGTSCDFMKDDDVEECKMAHANCDDGIGNFDKEIDEKFGVQECGMDANCDDEIGNFHKEIGNHQHFQWERNGNPNDWVNEKFGVQECGMDDVNVEECKMMDDAHANFDVDKEIGNHQHFQRERNEDPNDWVKKKFGVQECGMDVTVEDKDIVIRDNFSENSKSPAFHQQEHKCPGLGKKCLAGLAFGVDPNCVTAKEADFALKMTKLLINFTEKEREELAECILLIINAKETNSMFVKTRAPSSLADFNNFYLKGEKSIAQNLPMPTPQRTPDGEHVHISLTDTIANLLASATPVDNYEEQCCKFSMDKNGVNEDFEVTLSSTQRAHELLQELKGGDIEEDVMHLWMKEWSDGFDPSHTKSNRSQVWMKTHTTCPPHNFANKEQNTFTMSFANQSDEHESIEQFLSEELKDLKVGKFFYHGALRKRIKVKAGILCTCVDRPERTKIFKVGDHNGTHSVCWGHATEIDGQLKMNHLPDCDSCAEQKAKQSLMSNKSIEEENHCKKSKQKCGKWNLAANRFPTPKDFPTHWDGSKDAPKPPKDRIPKKNLKFLNTVSLDEEWLETAVEFAHHNMKTNTNNTCRKKWTKAEATAHLRTCAIGKNLIDSNCVSAKNKKEAVFPAMWERTGSIKKCHCAAMHMLFLGHVKSNFLMIKEWLEMHSMHTAFGISFNKVLMGVSKLKLKHFQAHSLSNATHNTGSYVSENYLCMGRLFKVMMTLPALQKNRDSSKNEFKNQLEKATNFCIATVDCIGRLMSPKKDVENLELSIHVHLNAMVSMDKILKPLMEKKKDTNKMPKPNFVKSNSLGLLEAAKAHKYFGPAILHWEGGHMGERTIQDAKPLMSIKRDGHADWKMITMTKIHRNDAINRLIGTNMHESSQKLFHVYQNEQDVQKTIEMRQPLSFVMMNSFLHCCFKGTNKSISLLQLHIQKGETIAGCTFFPMVLDNKVIEDHSPQLLAKLVQQHFLGIPKIVIGENQVVCYYCLTSDWKELKENGEIDFAGTLKNGDEE